MVVDIPNHSFSFSLSPFFLSLFSLFSLFSRVQLSGRAAPSGQFFRAKDRTDDPNPALHFLHFSHHLLCSLHHYNGLFVRLTA